MGRDVYEKLVRYKPQFLAFLPRIICRRSLASFSVKERSYIVVHVSVFKDVPNRIE